jgi:hypothetical protein
MRCRVLVLLLLAPLTVEGRVSQRRDPRRNVCIGVPKLTRHEVRLGMLRARQRLRACYRRALARSPQLAGVVNVAFRVTDSGATADVRVVSSTLKAPEVVRCLRAGLARMRFPQPAQWHGEVQVRYPFRFSPDDPDGRRLPSAIRSVEGAAFDVATKHDKQQPPVVVLTLRKGTQKRLAAAFPGHRLPEVKELAALPYPFAAVADLDRRGGKDLALVLASREQPERWIVAAVLGGEQPRVVKLTDADEVRQRLALPKGAALQLTDGSRCFCRRVCLSVAAETGKVLELEWVKGRWVKRVIDYFAPRAPRPVK